MFQNHGVYTIELARLLSSVSGHRAGYIKTLGSCAPYGALMRLALGLEKSPGSDEAEHVLLCGLAKEVFDYFTYDEKMLACCLFPDDVPFTAAMSWSMAKKNFGNDRVRWRVAFNGLLDQGWIVYSTSLGYTLSSLACLLRVTSKAVQVQDVYDTYVLHWAFELARLNQLASTDKSVLEFFSRNIQHFKRVLETAFQVTKNDELFATKKLREEQLQRQNSMGKRKSVMVVKKSAREVIVLDRDSDGPGEWIVQAKPYRYVEPTGPAKEPPAGSAPSLTPLQRKPTMQGLGGEDKIDCLSRDLLASDKVVKSIAHAAGGQIGRILTHLLVPSAAVATALAFRRLLDPSDGLCHDAAVVDLAEQLHRDGEVAKVRGEITAVIQTFYDPITGTVTNPPNFADRALIIWAKASAETTPSKAAAGIQQALKLMEQKGIPADHPEVMATNAALREILTRAAASPKQGVAVAASQVPGVVVVPRK